MSKRKWPFRPSHLTQAVKAFEKSGLPVRSVKINREGEIEVVAGKPQEPTPNDTEGSPVVL